MPNIDEKVVQMQFDNSEFDPNIKKSQKTFEEFEKTLEFKEGSKALKNFQKDMDKVDTKGLSKQLGKLGDSFSALETVAVGALLSVGNRLENFLNQSLRMALSEGATRGWGDYAEKVTSVQTIMAATSKQFNDTATQINYVTAELDELRTFTDETSYSFKDMTNNIGKFTSQGVKLSTAVTAMQGISTWAALSGANVNEASRAMYNISQAIGTGAVQLIDWKSIENANMATVEFKETVLEVAEAEGLLKKQADGTYKTLQNHAVSVANFNQNLSDKWFTSKVLLKSLDRYGGFAQELLKYTNETGDSVRDVMRWIDEYAEAVKKFGKDSEEVADILSDYTPEEVALLKKLGDETYDLGRRAFRAAQETKTFAEAWEYVKGTIATGWAQTWELIFGDYDEARKFWTDVTDDLYKIFIVGGEFRNEVMTLWSKTFGREEFVAGIKALREFIFGIDQGKEHINGLIDYIREAWEVVFPFWNNADSIASALVTITQKFAEWAESLKANEETMATLKSVVTFLGRALKFLIGVVKGVIIFFAPLVSWTKQLLKSLSGLFRSILDTGGAALTSKKFFEGLYTILLALGAVIALPIKALQKLIDFLSELGDKTWPEIVEDFEGFKVRLQNGLTDIWNKFINFGKNIVAGFWKGFTFAWKAVYTGVGKAFSGIVTLVKGIFGIHSPSTVFWSFGGNIVHATASGAEEAEPESESVIARVFKRIFEPVGNFFKGIVDSSGSVWNALKNILNVLLRIASAVGIIMLLVMTFKALFGVANIIWNIGYAMKSLGWAIDSVGRGIKKYLSRLGTAAIIQQMGNALLKFAFALGIVVAAFIVLSKIKLDNIGQAAWALGIIAGVLLAIVIVLSIWARILASRASMGLQIAGYLVALSVTITAISIAISILALSMALLTKAMNKNNAGFGRLMGIVLALSTLVIVVSIIARLLGRSVTFNRGAIRGAFAMLVIALVIKALAKAVFGLMDVVQELNAKYTAGQIAGAFAELTAIILVIGIYALVLSQAMNYTVKGLSKLITAMLIMVFTVYFLAKKFNETPALIGYMAVAIAAFYVLIGAIALLARAMRTYAGYKINPEVIFAFSKVLKSVALLFATLGLMAIVMEKISWMAIARLAVVVAGAVVAIVIIAACMRNMAQTMKGTQIMSSASIRNFRDVLIVFSAMLLTLTLIAIIFTFIPTAKIIKGLVSMTIIAGIAIALVVVVGIMARRLSQHTKDLTGSIKAIKYFKDILIVVAAMMLMLTGLVIALSFMDKGKLLKASGVVAVIGAVLIGIIMSISGAMTMLMRLSGNSKYNAEKIKAFIVVLAITLGALVFLAGAAVGMSFLNPATLLKATVSIAIIGAVVSGLMFASFGIIKLLSKASLGRDFSKKMLALLEVLGVVIVGMAVLAAGAWLLSKADQTALWSAVGALTAMTVLLLGAAAITLLLTKLVKANTAENLAPILASMVVLVAGLVLLTIPIAILGSMDKEAMWQAIGALAVLSALLLGSAAIVILLTKLVNINTLKNIIPVIAAMGSVIVSLYLFMIPVAILASMDTKKMWQAIGGIAAILGILLAAVGLMLLLSLAAGAIISTGVGLAGIIAVIVGMVVIAVMLALIAKPLKNVADALKYFQDTIGVKSLLVGVYILGLSLMLGIAGVLLLAAVPGMLAAAIGMVAFVAAATYAGKNANYISAFFDVIKDIASWKMLGKLALFAAGLAVLGLGMQILAPGLIGAAVAFVIWTGALILAGKYTDVIIDAFRIFSAITWEMVGGMAKLSLGLLALSVGLFAVSVPLMMIIIPLAALIGLGALLLETLYKLGKNMDLFAKAIDIVHAKLDKITDIIREFGKALGEVAPALQAFGWAVLIIGAGILVMAVGMLAAGIAGLVVVGVLFLFVLLLDRIKRDHPRLYDIIMDVVDGIAQMVKKEADLLGESYTLSKGLGDICKTLLGLVDSLGKAVGSVVEGIGDLVGGALTGLGNLFSGKNKEYKRLTELAEAQTNLANAQARLAEANVAFNTSLKELGPKLDSYLGSLSKSTGVFEQLGIIAQSYRSDIRRLGEDAKFLYSQLAKDTIKGYIDGLADGNAKLTAQADHMVKLILNTMKKGLDINSPSKKMYEIGEDAAEGFTLGSDEFLDKSVSVWKSRLGQIYEATKKTTDQIKGLFDEQTRAAYQSEFDMLDMRMKHGGLTSEEYKQYYDLQYKLSQDAAARRKQEKAAEAAKEESKTLGETLKNVGSDMKTIIEKVKSGEMTLKEGLSAAWSSLKTNFGGFLGDKFGDLKEWLLGDDGLLSGFRGLFDNLLNGDLFQGLGLEDYLPEIDENTEDIYDAMNTSDLTGAVDPTSGTYGSSNTINTYEFVQNNYSPKALSRIEIYRQTNRQFNNFRTREVLAR